MNSLAQPKNQSIKYPLDDIDKRTQAYYASFQNSIKELKSVLSSKEKQKNLQTLDELINEHKA